MENLNPLPKAISHKELNSLFKKAVKGNPSLYIKNSAISKDAEEFNQSLKLWERQSKELLTILKRRSSYISDGRKANSLMALGAMESHLNIAMQALKAYETNN